MSDVVDIKSRKEKKRASVIADDLTVSIHTMDLAIKALSFYAKYSAVAESISSLKTNKTLLEIHLKKYQKLCE